MQVSGCACHQTLIATCVRHTELLCTISVSRSGYSLVGITYIIDHNIDWKNQFFW